MCHELCVSWLAHAGFRYSYTLKRSSTFHALTQSIRETIKSGSAISDKELILFSRIGVTPLIEEVQRLLDQGELAGMKVYNRARLRGHLINLQTLLSKLDAK